MTVSGCGLCAGEDWAALIQHVSERIGEGRRSDGPDPFWAEAGEFWRERFGELTAVAVAPMRG